MDFREKNLPSQQSCDERPLAFFSDSTDPTSPTLNLSVVNFRKGNDLKVLNVSK